MCALQVIQVTNARPLHAAVGRWWTPLVPHTAEQPMSIHRVGGHATPPLPVGGQAGFSPQKSISKALAGWVGFKFKVSNAAVVVCLLAA